MATRQTERLNGSERSQMTKWRRAAAGHEPQRIDCDEAMEMLSGIKTILAKVAAGKSNMSGKDLAELLKVGRSLAQDIEHTEPSESLISSIEETVAEPEFDGELPELPG